MTQILIAVDSVGWTAVTCPFDCKTVVVSNNETSAQDVYERTDSADPATQITIPAGMQDTFSKGADPRPWTRFSAFRSGATVAWFKSASGSFNISARFTE